MTMKCPLIAEIVILGAILLSVGALVRSAELPFDPSRGLVEVEVLIDGRVKGRFGIDTGADRLYVDRTFATDNDLVLSDKSSERLVVGMGGATEATPISFRSLRIGDAPLYNLQAYAIDISALTTGDPRVHPDGLIGFSVLRNFLVTIDYPHRTMALRTGEPADVARARSQNVSFDLAGHMIIVEAVFNDSIAAPMLLDYCASYTTITRSLAERLHVESDDGAIVVLEKVDLQGLLIADNVTVHVTDMSSLTANLREGDFEGLLGGSFLAGFKITVDYPRKRIHLHE
jgi:predicted aspartyl protease